MKDIGKFKAVLKYWLLKKFLKNEINKRFHKANNNISMTLLYVKSIKQTTIVHFQSYVYVYLPLPNSIFPLHNPSIQVSYPVCVHPLFLFLIHLTDLIVHLPHKTTKKHEERL